MKAHQIWMLTGERGAGKTSLCRALAARAQDNGWDAAGLISPAVFANGIKTGILVDDVRRGESRPLAALEVGGTFDLPVGKWFFDRAVLAWGDRVLASSPPCDLLVVDELGPLELLEQSGWQSALQVLHGEGCRQALVVIRPELQALARQMLDISATLTIDQTRSPEQWMHLYWPEIAAACLPGSRR